MTWSLLYAQPSIRITHFGPLVCVNFLAPPPTAELKASFDAQEQLFSRYAELTQLVFFDVDLVRAVNGELRTTAGARLRSWGPRLGGAAIVLQGEGLPARLLRVAIMTGIALSGAGDRQRIFPARRSALQWLQTLPRQATEVAQASLTDLLTVGADLTGAGGPPGR